MDKEKLKQLIKNLIDEIDDPRIEENIFFMIMDFFDAKIQAEFGDTVLNKKCEFINNLN